MHRTNLLTFLLLLSVLASVSLCALAKNVPVEQLKTRFVSAHPEDRPAIGIEIAQSQLRTADKLYSAGNNDAARAAVDDVVTYSEKARDAATQVNKHLKNVEIDVRKMAEKLRDIKRTLSVEDQPPVEAAIRRLEDVRTTLLKAMFTNDKKDKK